MCEKKAVAVLRDAVAQPLDVQALGAQRDEGKQRSLGIGGDGHPTGGRIEWAMVHLTAECVQPFHVRINIGNSKVDAPVRRDAVPRVMHLQDAAVWTAVVVCDGIGRRRVCGGYRSARSGRGAADAQGVQLRVALEG